MVHEVYEEYTTTTFTMNGHETKKPQERQPREANFFFFYLNSLNIKLGPSFKCKHSQVRVKYW
jgi:hypothetical protein